MFVYSVLKKNMARVCAACFMFACALGVANLAARLTGIQVISSAYAEYFNPHLQPVNPRYLQRPRPVYGHRVPIVVALTPQEAANRLARQGFRVRNLWMQGDVYMAQGYDRRRVPVRVVVDPYEGRVLEVTALGAPARSMQNSPIQNAVRPPLDVPQQMQVEREKQPPVVEKRKNMLTHIAAQKRKERLAALREEKRQAVLQAALEAKKERRLALAQRRAKAKSRYAKADKPHVVTFKAPRKTNFSANTVQKKLINASSGAMSSQKPAVAPVEEVRPEVKRRAVDKI